MIDRNREGDIFLMKKKKLIGLLVACVLLVSCSVFLWRQMKMKQSEVYQPRANYQPYPFESKTLSNGLRVLLVKDELPYISYSILFKASSRFVPASKQGLRNVLVGAINQGTKKRNFIRLTDDLELLGASMVASIEKDSISLSSDTLSWLRAPLLDIFSEIITKPLFSVKDFLRIKKQALGIAHRMGENFSPFASHIFTKYVYEDHPYGFYINGSLKTLASITLQDVKKFYDKYFRSDQAILGISGNYEKDVIAQLEQAFKNWKPAKQQKISNKKRAVSSLKSRKEKILVVNHPSAVQAEIRMGHLSIKRSHPDYLGLTVANIILGGSMSSRLMNRIRTQKGLTYHVYSALSANREQGVFQLNTSVRNEKLGEALVELMSVLEYFYSHGITKEELKKAKELLRTRFVKLTSRAENYVWYLMYLHSNGVPYSYATNYFVNLDALTMEKVNSLIKKYLHLDKIKTLIFSNAEDIEMQLKDYNQPFTVKGFKEFM